MLQSTVSSENMGSVCACFVSNNDAAKINDVPDNSSDDTSDEGDIVSVPYTEKKTCIRQNTEREENVTRPALRLEDINPAEIELFTYRNTTYDCIIAPEDIYDGDTVKVVIIRNDEVIKLSLRLSGIDSPELKPRLVKVPDVMTSEQEEEIRYAQNQRTLQVLHAKQSRDALRDYIQNKRLQVDFMGEGKFGREIGVLYVVNSNGERENINEWMIKNKYAREYIGKKREPWIFATEEIDDIEDIEEPDYVSITSSTLSSTLSSTS